MQVFIARGEEQHGPYPLEQIKDLLAKGVLKPGDYAYHEGLSGWKPLSEIIAAQSEPAVPHAKVASPSSVAGPSDTATSTTKPKSNAPLIIGIVAGLFILVGLAAAVGLYFLLRDKPPELAFTDTPDYIVPPLKPSTTPPLPTDPSTLTSGLPGVDPEPNSTNPNPPPPAGKLTPEEVEEILADEIGTWEVRGHRLLVTDPETGLPGKPQDFEDKMETRWKEKGKSTVATFNPVINGKKVPFVGYKEYDAEAGVFIWRAKGEGLPGTVSRERYDPVTKTFHGQADYPNNVREISTLQIISKDRSYFKSKVYDADNQLVQTSEILFTRADDPPSTNPEPAAGSLADNIIGKRIVCEVPGNLEMLLQFEKDGTFNVARIVAGKVEPEDDDLTYVVDGLKAKVKEMGEEDGGVTFTSTNPKKGDQITFGPAKNQMAATILRIETAAPFEKESTTNPEPTPPEPNVNQKGLIAYYPFNGNACDESGNGHGGKVVGAKLTDDRLGKADSAYQFKLGDHIRIDGLMGKPKNLTLSAWFKLEGPQGRMGSEIISLGVSASIRVDSKSTFVQRVGTGGVTRMQPNGWMNTLVKFNYTGTGWHQIVFTFDDDADRQVTYVDGKQMALKENQRSIVYEGKETDTVIGIHGRGMETWRSQGKIDDIRVYDRALDAAEVKALFLSEKSAFPLQAANEIKVTTVAELRAKAQAGDPKVQLSLGLKIINGADGLKKNPAMTEKWWLRAAKQGHTIAQMNLGLLYSRGALGEKDPARAYQWAKLSLMRGNQRAKQLVETLEKELMPDQIAQADAFLKAFKPVPENAEGISPAKPEPNASNGLSAQDVERIAAQPHQPILNNLQLVSALLKPGMWERIGRIEVQKTPEQEARVIERKLIKKIKHVQGKYVVIETTDEKGVKLLTELHSYDPVKKAMHSTSVNARGLLTRRVGVSNPNTRTVNWKSVPAENDPQTLELSITCAQDGLSAQLVGRMHREGTLISTFTGELKRVGDFAKPAKPEPKTDTKETSSVPRQFDTHSSTYTFLSNAPEVSQVFILTENNGVRSVGFQRAVNGVGFLPPGGFTQQVGFGVGRFLMTRHRRGFVIQNYIGTYRTAQVKAAPEETPENQRPRPVFRTDPEPVDRSRRWQIKTVEEAG